MEKISCDIIQDLIPSYVDHICSEASRTCVEEHLTTCNTCKKMAELCKDNAFSATTLEQEQLDAFKKLKSKIKHQNLFSYLLLLFLVFWGIYAFAGSNNLSTHIYYVLLTACLIGTSLFTIHGQPERITQKKNIALIGSSVLFNIFSIILLFWSLSQLAADQIPFGLEPHEIGPLLKNWLIICFLLQLLLFVCLLLRMLRKNLDLRYGLCITQTGAFLQLLLISLLHNMSPLEVVASNLLEILLVTTILGTLSAGTNLLLRKKNIL